MHHALRLAIAAAAAAFVGAASAAGAHRPAGPPERDVDTASSASAAFDFPHEDMPLRVGIVRYVRPSPFAPIVEATVGALKGAFGARNVEVTEYSLVDLADAIRAGRVDLFLSSSGFYVRMNRLGARAVATAASRDYPDPNHSDGTAIVVAADRTDLQSLESLRGARLALSTPTAFTGRQLPEHTILKAGLDPETLFSRRTYLGDGPHVAAAIPMLLEGKADVAFLRLCLLEEWQAKRPADRGKLRVINRRDTPEHPEACARSTPLYPSWTVATTPAMTPEISRLVLQALFEMRPTSIDGLYWSAATDYASVDAIFRDLRIGPYAYLREWTVSRILKEYGPWLAVLAALALGLVLHSVSVTRLMRIRTAHLQRALAERERLQAEAREAAERIERLNRAGAVAQLSSIFAHEMRQPLATMSLYLFGLKKLLASGSADPEKIAAVVGRLEAQTARADAIVDRVRAYARHKNPVRVDTSLVEAARRAVAELAASRRWHTAVSLAAPEDVRCLADPLELELVALNLVKNALEAVEGRPDARVQVSVLENAGTAELTVINDGPKVPPETIARLEEGGPSTKPDGLGLGLSIVRSIVERLGGRLAFAAMPEGGLAAVAAVPVTERARAAAERSRRADENAGTSAASGGDRNEETPS